MTEEPTTPCLLELTRRLVAVSNRRDFDGAISFYAPDVVFDLREPLGLVEGRAAMRDLLEDWTRAYEDSRLELEESRDLGHGVGFAVVVQHGRLPGSASWLRFRYVAVATWVNGLIEQQTNYPESDIDEARADAERLAEERGWAVSDDERDTDG
jgi:ketosteroid isomerase-like protein